MIYLVGGAPRVGKSILSQRVAAKLTIGWICTDLLKELVDMRAASVTNVEWNAPETIAPTAEWFFPYLERFVWGINSLTKSYLIEGVHFLPTHVAQLSAHYRIRCVFLGCSNMTLERFEDFPGRSRGYTGLPEELRHQIVHHVPMHSELVRREAERFGYRYVDMVGDFHARLDEADAVLTAGAVREEWEPSG
jgi:hypothetical protein